MSDATSPADPSPTSERIVERLGFLLAVVPSIAPALRGWRRLGFEPGEPGDYLGCDAFEIRLRGCGVRVLAPKLRKSGGAFARKVSDHLAGAPGLLGWSWASDDPESAAAAVRERTGADGASVEDGRIVLPAKITPGAATVIETVDRSGPAAHPNGVDRMDHVVLMVNDSERTVDAYRTAFALRPKTRAMKNGVYSFMKIGGEDASVVEVVGPDPARPGALEGRAWGVTFGTPDLDSCLASMRERGVQVRDPHPALQGGRIMSLAVPFGGVQIAIIGP